MHKISHEMTKTVPGAGEIRIWSSSSQKRALDDSQMPSPWLGGSSVKQEVWKLFSSWNRGGWLLFPDPHHETTLQRHNGSKSPGRWEVSQPLRKITQLFRLQTLNICSMHLPRRAKRFQSLWQGSYGSPEGWWWHTELENRQCREKGKMGKAI